jgi:hypothetical protein
MHVQAQRGGRGLAPPICNLGIRKGWCGQHHALATLSHGKNPVHVVQEAGWVSGPVHMAWKTLPPLGFDLPSFQPTASRYTHCAILATFLLYS